MPQLTAPPCAPSCLHKNSGHNNSLRPLLLPIVLIYRDNIRSYKNSVSASIYQATHEQITTKKPTFLSLHPPLALVPGRGIPVTCDNQLCAFFITRKMDHSVVEYIRRKGMSTVCHCWLVQSTATCNITARIAWLHKQDFKISGVPTANISTFLLEFSGVPLFRLSLNLSSLQ